MILFKIIQYFQNLNMFLVELLLNDICRNIHLCNRYQDLKKEWMSTSKWIISIFLWLNYLTFLEQSQACKIYWWCWKKIILFNDNNDCEHFWDICQTVSSKFYNNWDSPRVAPAGCCKTDFCLYFTSHHLKVKLNVQVHYKQRREHKIKLLFYQKVKLI